jgi:transcriptional regulator with XRE-family HTH domain
LRTIMSSYFVYFTFTVAHHKKSVNSKYAVCEVVVVLASGRLLIFRREFLPMKTFSDKVREGRTLLNLTQEELGRLIGVSKRAVLAYETEGVLPRRSVKEKLAEALRVSLEYLERDDISDPTYGLEKTAYIEETRERFGNRAAREMDFLLERNAALFAGGAITQEAKDAFFEAVTKAYWAAKEESRKTYGHKIS